MQSLVANSDRNNVKININKFYNIKVTEKIKKIYDHFDLYEEQDNPDLVDNSGYFGIFYRKKIDLEDITEEQFL